HGLHYAPDPSSQTACTIGGNVAENAGGPHCLKYGVTAQHVLALEVVLADGRIVELGSPGGEPWGPDVVGLFVGSEGNFGIATRIAVRLLPLPRAVRTLLAAFASPAARSEAKAARRVRTARGGGGFGGDRERHRSRRPRDDGPVVHPGGRGF